MIGNGYWSTGIVFAPRQDGLWSVWLEFLDDGWAAEAATEGTLRVRYQVVHLDEAIDILKADAERLGIVWRNPGGGEQTEGVATVYVEGDGERHGEDRPDLRRLANDQAVRLGWDPVYRREFPQVEDPTSEAFDRAIVRFLNERVPSGREPEWKVDAEGEDDWEVRLWLNGEYIGSFRVTEDGSELLSEVQG